MRIWLLNPYGPIPGEGWREYRFAHIGRALARRGHEVTWWTATFAHHFKEQRAAEWRDVAVEPGFTIRLVPTPGYVSNVSLRRLWFELVFAWQLRRRAWDEAPPESVVVVEPPQIVSFVATLLARRFGAKLHVDVLDLWPELFETVGPGWARAPLRLMFAPLRHLRGRNLRRADLITAVCSTYASVAQRETEGLRTPVETVYIGVDVRDADPGADSPDERRNLRARLGVDTDAFVAIYAGSLGAHYDIDTLVQAAQRLEEAGSRVRILVAGDGPLRTRVEAAVARGIRNLFYLGRVEPEALWMFYRASDVGLCTYGSGSTVALPVKAYDYLAAGLPIVSSLSGELEVLLREHGAGVHYEAGNAESLASSLHQLSVAPEHQLSMCRSAQSLGQRFDSREQYARMVELMGA